MIYGDSKLSAPYQTWLDYMILMQWPFYGALARTFQDNRDENKRGFALMQMAAMNGLIAFSCSQIVIPIATEMQLSSNWQHGLLYISGYMGLGFIDIIQAQVRYQIHKRFGGDPDDANNR